MGLDAVQCGQIPIDGIFEFPCLQHNGGYIVIVKHIGGYIVIGQYYILVEHIIDFLINS